MFTAVPGYAAVWGYLKWIRYSVPAEVSIRRLRKAAPLFLVAAPIFCALFLPQFDPRLPEEKGEFAWILILTSWLISLGVSCYVWIPKLRRGEYIF